MKRFEQSLFRLVVASAGSACFVMACTAVPPAVTGGEGAAAGTVAGTTGSSSGAGGSAGPGQGGSRGFTLPDAAVVFDDVLTDTVTASGDVNCGAVQNELQRKPADLLLVLDRSTSMTQAMDTDNNCSATSTTCAQRWATIISSLDKVLGATSKDLNWGLKLFSSPASSGTGGRGGGGGGRGTGGRGGGFNPGGGSCNVSAGVEVPVGPGNNSKIQTQISAAGNAGYTPTRLALNASVEYLKTVTDGNNKFILLATDGQPNCAGTTENTTDDLEPTKTAAQDAVAAGYKVFVIGVGPKNDNLTGLAQAGGTEKFYPAQSPGELSAALDAIVGIVAAGCTYELPTAPVPPDAVGVYIDKELIPQSDSDGWSYAPGSSTTININGSYCDALTRGDSKQVQIFLPCEPSAPIPTTIP